MVLEDCCFVDGTVVLCGSSTSVRRKMRTTQKEDSGNGDRQLLPGKKKV